MKNTTIILGKERTADRIETPAKCIEEGRLNSAEEMRDHNVARELFFQVGKHVWLVVEWNDGRRSMPRKIY